MASEKSHNPFENLDSEHTNLSNRNATTTASVDPPPYTTTTTTTAPAPVLEPPQTPKPIAIPALEPTPTSPFLRAYAPLLQSNYNLPRDQFLPFLDHLNTLITNNSPLQVLDATGSILQSVPLLFPLHWLGSAVSGLANLGSQGISKSRTDAYIKQANRGVFAPCGLRVEVVRFDALAYVAGIPVLDAQGKVGGDRLRRVLDEAGGNAAAAAVDVNRDGDMRVKALQPWIAELEVDVLPWTSRSKLTRFNAAWKKRNYPGQVDSSSGGGQKSESDVEEGLRKCLWLVIRPI